MGKHFTAVLAALSSVSLLAGVQKTAQAADKTEDLRPTYSVAAVNLPNGSILTNKNISPVKVQEYSQFPRGAVSGYNIFFGIKIYKPLAKGEPILSKHISAAKNGITVPEPLFSQYSRAATQCIKEKRYDDAGKYAWGALADLEKLAANTKGSAKLSDFKTTASLIELTSVYGSIYSSKLRDREDGDHGRAAIEKELPKKRQELLFHQRLQTALRKLLPAESMYVTSAADYLKMDTESIAHSEDALKSYKELDALRK